ncbi:MAG: thioredoxin TrxA [Sodalis sp. (in: enterobacteria)]
MNDKILCLSDNSFEKDILQNNGLFLVDFWAEWCTPCKLISVSLEEIADEFEDKLIIAKLNIDKNPKTTKKYGVRSIPTLLLFRNGEVVGTKVGMLSKEHLKEFFNTQL